jgi:hypothetical protein
VKRILKARQDAPEPIELLKTFEARCRAAGFPAADAGPEALREEGAVAGDRSQSGRINLFLQPP